MMVFCWSVVTPHLISLSQNVNMHDSNGLHVEFRFVIYVFRRSSSFGIIYMSLIDRMCEIMFRMFTEFQTE